MWFILPVATQMEITVHETQKDYTKFQVHFALYYFISLWMTIHKQPKLWELANIIITYRDVSFKLTTLPKKIFHNVLNNIFPIGYTVEIWVQRLHVGQMCTNIWKKETALKNEIPEQNAKKQGSKRALRSFFPHGSGILTPGWDGNTYDQELNIFCILCLVSM